MPLDNNWPFTAQQISGYINRIDNKYGLLRSLGLFSEKSSTLATVTKTESRISLGLIPSRPRGVPGVQMERGKQKAITVEVPHFPLEDTILPQDIQDILQQSGPLRQGNQMLVEHLARIRLRHEQNLEWLRFGAIQGVIHDADGGSVIHDLFELFDIARPEVDFKLGTATTNIRKKCDDVLALVGDNLEGNSLSSVLALVSPEFMDKLLEHENFQKYYMNHQAALDLTASQREGSGGDTGRVVNFGGIKFREVRGVMSGQRLIKPDDGALVPLGTLPGTFETVYAPANTMSAANKPGQFLHIGQKVLDFDQGIMIRSESNPLPICWQPGLLVRIYSSN